MTLNKFKDITSNLRLDKFKKYKSNQVFLISIFYFLFVQLNNI